MSRIHPLLTVLLSVLLLALPALRRLQFRTRSSLLPPPPASAEEPTKRLAVLELRGAFE